MNTKTNLVKSIGFTAVVSALTAAYAFQPAKPTEPVYVMAPFKLDEINVKAEQATLLTANDEYSLEVEFDAEYFMDGNGVGHNWRDVEVKEIKDIHVYSEDGEIQAYVDRLDVVEIKEIIEQELRERV
ncbi:hypothetical protein [Acinetobacter junii]|uniref:hypothetical protein n=1 Tax=Acinetobacter junii TaxID=40215 RepID=UPI00244A9F20|nr:hypothetical protein [Acinetobacter junii]MDH1005716.1 hypothetical protein [Acinetobacter junii]MDH1005787.1 hypothetical protein [Acinetobacter junii]